MNPFPSYPRCDICLPSDSPSSQRLPLKCRMTIRDMEKEKTVRKPGRGQIMMLG